MTKFWRITEAWRIGCVIMMGHVTGLTDCGFRAAADDTALAGLAAMFLALAGFHIGYLANWRWDRASGKMLNPIAAGELSPGVGFVFAASDVAGCAILGYIVDPLVLLPAAGVLFFVTGTTRTAESRLRIWTGWPRKGCDSL